MNDSKSGKRPGNQPGDIGDIPPIVPARDEVASRQNARKPARGKRNAAVAGGGSGLLARLFITISLAVAGVACGWAWQLQQELDTAEQLLARYESRISDLEDRLSDTDEGMNQSAATMAVKIKELYSEVDKLWASAWRRNKAAIAELEKSRDSLNSKVASLAQTDTAYSNQLQALGSDLQKLRAVAGDLERLVTTADANQALLERLGDDVSRATLELARLQKRMDASEEWQASVDGFRKQVNQSLIQLRQSVGSAPGGAPGAG
jgi:predicted  nucleic acid-binding Zn-ribbon protein